MTEKQRGAPLSHVIAVAALMLALVAGGLASAGAAWAHAALIASDPAENAELPQPPPRVSATFNEPMQAQFAAMTVIGPDGDNWSDGDPQVDGAVISVDVRPGGPAGAYTVNYRATSADGHVVSGSWTYRATSSGSGNATSASTPAPTPATAPATTTAAPATEPADDGLPVWPFVAATTVIVAAGALWAVRRRS